jgi:beta-galactosidase
MFLAVQYYRPPFPPERCWADDFSRIRDAGLHAVQLWCVWGWIEAEPSVYDYHDYDRLVALADKKGLKVVLSTIAEIHPFWIHRLVPGSEMVDHMGRRVVSSCRQEVNVGLTPGGCFDHPRVAELMRGFLTDIARRYVHTPNLLGWDVWNETRWAVHADGHVCYCPNTLMRFREWLDRRHGGLEGLSAAWQRRYVSWEDVFPGKLPGRPYTEMMEFLRFLADRSAEHMRLRVDAIRAGDSHHFLGAHCSSPSVMSTGCEQEQALSRGVDWDHADALDGFGCSHFPFWGEGFDEDGFGVRVEICRSANRGKVTWVSELQGGTARDGIVAHRSVEAAPQQRWVANGMARGAKAVIFWCWRDEVFGRESSGFGLDGWDGLAEDRLAAMRKTARFIDERQKLIDGYRADPARAGVLFVRDNYFLKWAESGNAADAGGSVVACATALERLRIPYDLVEAQHLDALENLEVLFMPYCLVLPEEARRAVLRFVKRGGTILTEAETDAFDDLGFYRYPDERPFMKALGVQDNGRRKMDPGTTLRVKLGKRTFELALDKFLTPLSAPRDAEVLAVGGKREPLLVRKTVGKGVAYVLGSFAALAYARERSEGLERLMEEICETAGLRRDFDVDAKGGTRLLQWRSGVAGKEHLLWIINGGAGRTVTVTDGAGKFGRASSVTELTGGKSLPIRTVSKTRRCVVEVRKGGFVVLKW